jgi:hypothetical protein
MEPVPMIFPREKTFTIAGYTIELSLTKWPRYLGVRVSLPRGNVTAYGWHDIGSGYHKLVSYIYYNMLVVQRSNTDAPTFRAPQRFDRGTSPP